MRWIILAGTHAVALAVGFAAGVFFLPILIAPDGPDEAVLAAEAERARFTATLTRDLAGSDFAHWGEGSITVSDERIAHSGALAPGPDYKLYLTTEFVEDEAQFEAARANAVRIGDVKSFDGFIVDVPPGVDVSDYNTAVVWCESFSEFITAGQYR